MRAAPSLHDDLFMAGSIRTAPYFLADTMTCRNPEFCSSFVPSHASGDDESWPEKFDKLFGAGDAQGPGEPDHPKVAGYLAGFLAFVVAMLAAAALVTDQLPLVVVGL